MAADDEHWWWSLSRGQAELGRQTRAADRLGPYPSREAAEAHAETVAARNEAWDRGEDD